MLKQERGSVISSLTTSRAGGIRNSSFLRSFVVQRIRNQHFRALRAFVVRSSGIRVFLRALASLRETDASEAFEAFDVYDEDDGAADEDFDGGGHEGADRGGIRGEDVDELLAGLGALADHLQDLFDLFLFHADEKRDVALAEE